MYVVSYEIIGDAEAPETGTASSFELLDPAAVASSSAAADVPTVRSLWEGWPYEGRFHFRARVPFGIGGAAPEDEEEEYGWLDLTDADAPLPVWREEQGQKHVHVRVLPLALPPAVDAEAASGAEGETLDYSGGDLDDDILEVSYGTGAGGASLGSGSMTEGEQEQDRYRRRASSGCGGGGGVGAVWSQSLKEATETVLTSDIARDATKLGKQVGKQVGKGVNRLFKAVLNAATAGPDGAAFPSSGGGGGTGYPGTAPTPASHAAIKTLRSLEEAVSRQPSADLLAGLWQALFPNAGIPFAARSPQWRSAGFSGDDPLPDLRGTGSLTVHCIIHLARLYPARLAAMLRAQAPRDEAHYPFAAVANSVTVMLIDIFKLRDGRYQNVQAGLWGMFEGSRGQGAVEAVFARCLVYFDRRWSETGATRQQFSGLMQETRRRLENVLGQGPASVAEFGRLAEAGGLCVDD